MRYRLAVSGFLLIRVLLTRDLGKSIVQWIALRADQRAIINIIEQIAISNDSTSEFFSKDRTEKSLYILYNELSSQPYMSILKSKSPPDAAEMLS